MLIDEAFSKMGLTNVIATIQYLEQLNLQIFLASPGEHIGTLTAFLHRYYEIQRDVYNNTVSLEKYDITPEARDLYREDLPEFHPELLAKELASIKNAANSQPAKKAEVH